MVVKKTRYCGDVSDVYSCVCVCAHVRERYPGLHVSAAEVQA